MSQVIIPWRDSGEKDRLRHFNFLYSYYSQEYEVVIGDNEGDFNRSAARNAGVRASDDSIVMLIDADNFIPIPQLQRAAKLSLEANYLVKPFKEFGYLTEKSTNQFYFHWPEAPETYKFQSPPQRRFTGGAYVMTRRVWNWIGGFDEGFVGWGGEDDAFHLAAEKTGVPTTYLPSGMDLHLYHPSSRWTSEENYAKLVNEYVNR